MHSRKTQCPGASEATGAVQNVQNTNNKKRYSAQSRKRLNFAYINRVALSALPAILERVLPGGYYTGAEYTVRNPRRNDHTPGSFRINIRKGCWKDFSSGDGGGDPVSLIAFLFDLTQLKAACHLANLLGIEGGQHD